MLSTCSCGHSGLLGNHNVGHAMNDDLAQKAYDDYNESIRFNRGSVTASQHVEIMRLLWAACDYLNAIPIEQRTEEQDKLRIKISGLLMGV